MILPNDIARCAGVWIDDEGWRADCEDCLRRTDHGVGDDVLRMAPPPIIVFECEYRLAPAGGRHGMV